MPSQARLVSLLLAHLTKRITGVLISPQPDQEGNKLQGQKVLMFIYPIYNQNWRNIGTICIYQDQHQKKYSNHQTKHIGKQVGLRTYQHPCSNVMYVFINIQFIRSKTASVFDLGFAGKRVTRLSHFKCLRDNTTLCRGQLVVHELRVERV